MEKRYVHVSVIIQYIATRIISFITHLSRAQHSEQNVFMHVKKTIFLADTKLCKFFFEKLFRSFPNRCTKKKYV